MKKLLYIISVIMLYSMPMFSQQWTYNGKANTNNFVTEFGVQYLVVDPSGKIWAAPYSTPNDSLWVPDSAKFERVHPIYVFNENGTPNDTIKYVQVGTKFMPFYGHGYGLTLDNNGDIIVSKNGNLYRINHITHQGMNILERPYGGNTIASPAVSSNGDVYINQLAPNAPLKIFNYDFSFKANAIDMLNDYARLLVVSGDGNTIYVPEFMSNYTLRLRKPDRFSPYIADTVLIGAAIESGVWDNVDSTKLWFSVGNYTNQASGEFTGSNNTWIKFDTSNWARKDSIKWVFTNINNPDERPRGIAFNKTGDAYVTVFGSTIDTIIEKFHNPQHVPSVNQFTWKSSITIKDNGNSQQTLTFGMSPIATDGIDTTLGEQLLPPVPPLGIFDSRFLLPIIPSESSILDYRMDSLKTAGWTFSFQPGTGGYPITITWDSTALPPSGSFFLKDIITGTIVNLNMKTASSYTVTNTGITSLKIEYSKLACGTVLLSSGWNLLSVPVVVSDMNTQTLFPDYTSPTFCFNNRYEIVTTLSNGKGYWVKYANAANRDICGIKVPVISIPVNQGWNLIGVYDNDISAASVTTTPTGILSSQFFGFGNGYYNANVLLAGRGYWIKASKNGVINISSGQKGTNKDVFTAGTIKSEWGKITITDRDGRTGVLYTAKGNVNLDLFELPPVPPSDVFDIRFSSNRNVEVLNTKETEIVINSKSFPITIRAEGINIRITDKITGKLVDLSISSGKSIVLQKDYGHLSVEAVDKPIVFTLEQNYPNPFNPSTSIGFSVPEKAGVELSIYNVLGEKVQTLVNSEMEEGYHQVVWNAGNMSSGIYFYKLTTNKYSCVKKLILMK